MVQPFSNNADRILRLKEPYHFQRYRHTFGEYPKAPQPNTYQPNRPRNTNGNSTRNYWESAYQKYLNRRV